MPTERLTFPGRAGRPLDGRLEAPDGPVRAYALFAHCFSCGKDSLAASRIARALATEGVATLRFDFTGLGGSDGDFGAVGFSGDLEDLRAAADFMTSTGRAPELLVGHSLGGAAVLAVAASLASVRAVATIGAPLEAAHVLQQFPQALTEIDADGDAEVTLGGKTFTVTRRFVEDVRAHRQEARLKALRCGLLILHSPTDEVVGVDNAGEIWRAARHPKSFVALDGADHLLTRSADAAYAATVIAAWAGRYLGPRPAEPGGLAETPAGLLPGEVDVIETRDGKFRQAVRIGRHALTVDEPTHVGGDDAGPGPYDLILAALGACTAMTLRLYADGKGLALDRVAVRLSHDRVHEKDCEGLDTGPRLDRVTREITLAGSLTDAERARLLQIADKCPVHRTLTERTLVETRLTSPMETADA